MMENGDQMINDQNLVQLDYNLEQAEEVYLINSQAAKLAKECTREYMEKHPGSRKFVAGAVGPTNKTLSVSPSVENPAYRGITYEEVEEAYYQQLKGLYDGGVDLFLVGTGPYFSSFQDSEICVQWPDHVRLTAQKNGFL